MSTNRYFAIVATLAAVAGLAASTLASAYSIYTVGGDAACQFAFIQDAIDAAAANPGEDYVWIASNRTYEDQHLVVTDQDIDIEGGFTDCTDFDPGLDQTTIGGTSGHSVFEIEGSSHVYLGNMIITGAVMDADHSGGGIYFGGQGALQLNFTWVFANQAGYGGGIDVSPSGPTTLTLTASTVSDNTALVSGGGIRIEGPTTLIATHSPSQSDNYISQNGALGQDDNGGYGGGIEVLGPAIANFSSVLALNTAPNGGGIAAIATDSGPATINIYTTDANSPVSIYGNRATGWGGGIYLEPYIDNRNDATLCMNDFAVDANVASDGSAIYMFHSGYLGGVAYLNTPSACTPQSGAAACAPGQPCNEMNDNVTEDDDNTPTNGSTVRVWLDAAFSASRFAARRNNSHDGDLLEFYAHASNIAGRNYVRLHDCLLADNIVGDHLLNGDGHTSDSQMILDTCTVANNQMSGGAAMAVIGADLQSVEITNSIVYQPDHEVVDFSGTPDNLIAEYVLANSVASLDGGIGAVEGAPDFLDSASGDYHLARTSPGIDMAPGFDGYDLDGNPRDVDLLDIPNGWGAMDVGAYEIQNQLFACYRADTIFCDGFDE